MRERERIALNEFREEFEAEEGRKQEQRERPLREAEAQFQETARQLAKVERENLLTLPDPDGWFDSATEGKRLTIEEAKKLAVKSAEEFVERHPEYWPTKQNYEIFDQYFTANEKSQGTIITEKMFNHAYIRLRDAGLLEERPAPEPIQEPEHVEQVQEQPACWFGIDQSSGLEREFSQWEIERMDSETYKRTFRLPSIYGRQIDPRTREEAL